MLIFFSLTPATLIGNIQTNLHLTSYTQLDNIKDSLIKYENWISNNFYFNGTIIKEWGYPSYLSGFAELYRGLSLYESDDYRTDYYFILSYILSSHNNWTWDSDWYGTSPTYSLLNARSFYFAFEATHNQTYLTAFMNTIKGLNFFYDGEKLNQAFNINFNGFVFICKALKHGLLEESYRYMAMQLLNFSLKYYNESTSEWYQFDHILFQNGYNSRAAYYQLITITWFLMNRNDIKEIFPDVYEKLMDISYKSINLIKKNVLDTGTFYYLPEVPDYTESGAYTMYGFLLFDRIFGVKNPEIINSALKTILNRQRNDGAYYKSNNTKVDLWYTDNIPIFFWQFYELKKNLIRNNLILAISIPAFMYILLIIVVYNKYRSLCKLKNFIK